MQEHLSGRDWRADLVPVWREFFQGIGPDLNNLPDWDAPEVFPPRLNLERPREAEDRLPLCHMTRAFDDLMPHGVRVVIIGQDPYPQRDRATGRAFEDGVWDEANPTLVADSLRRLLQSAAAHEHPDLRISEERDDWDRVCQAIREEQISPPVMPEFFNALAEQGVLSINAAWTFTGKARTQLDVHLGIWKPVMQHLLLKLVRRESRMPIVFLLLGGKAQSRFRAATHQHIRTNPVPHVGTVCCAHPTSWTGRTYFDYENPLAQVNRELIRLEADPVRWWPLVE